MKTVVYFVSHITDSGGVSRVVSLKANYLADVLGYQVHIISTNDLNDQPFYAFSERVQVHFLPMRVKGISSFLAYKKACQQWIKQLQPNLVLVTDNGIKGLFIKKWLPEKMPCIYELHVGATHFYEAGYAGIKKYVNQYVIKRYLPDFDKIVVLRPQFILPFVGKEKQCIIPNPLSFETHQKNHLQHQKAIAVGRIIPLKGYERMLTAWKRVVALHPNYVLHLYGATAEGYDVYKIIEKKQLQEVVVVHQPTAKIKEKLLEADFLLHASYFEAFPMVFLEAMQCSLPVVCYDIGANDFIDEKGGFIATNENEYVSAVEQLIENVALRASMGAHNKEKSNRYQLHTIMSYWEALFNEVK